ncbi:MAG: hypothetical protein M3P08_01930 [Thermoproteota archaeon]|nr:hypothetical protein [Thermoproteota archaeon]
MVRDINFNEYIDDLCGRRRCRCLGSSDVYHFRYVDGVQKVSNEGISNATMLIKETKEIKERRYADKRHYCKSTIGNHATLVP